MDEADLGRDCYPGNQPKSSKKKDISLANVGALGLYKEKHEPVLRQSDQSPLFLSFMCHKEVLMLHLQFRQRQLP